MEREITCLQKRNLNLSHSSITKILIENSNSKPEDFCKGKQHAIDFYGKHIRVLVCLFYFGAYIITFQNTDFKSRCLISLLPTVVAGKGEMLSKCWKIYPELP